MRKKLTPQRTIVVALGLAFSTMAAAVADEPKASEPAKVVDVAICLDVSNSMDGLIASAKQKLWDIVNDLAKAKPAPKLRVAVFSYGNTGYEAATGWVKKDLDLTDDLDKVSEKLFGLTTRGGNEYVARVSRDAIDQLQWSNEPAALKIIFVCGNEPADQDKTVPLNDVAEKAARKGIVINTIYCGRSNSPDTKRWQEFAVLAEGRYACVDQDRGTVAVATPMDKELAELSGKLNKTYVFYGKDGAVKAELQLKQDVNAANLGAPAAAARAVSKGGALYKQSDSDLVEKLKEDPKFDVKKVPTDQLSDELKKLSPEEREKYVKERLAERESLQKRVAELGKKRDEYIESERKKNPSKAVQAFDEAVRGALREQAKKKGIDIP